MASIDSILVKFRDVRRAGKGWIACCPIHKGGQERNPSLGIFPSQDGEEIILHCHTCHADRKDIAEAAGLSLIDLCCTEDHGDALGPVPNFYLDGVPVGLTERIADSQKKIEAIYPYTDEHGELLYEVVRYYPKAFRQRRYNEFTPDKYIWSLGDVRRVLYHLSEIAANPGIDVHVCEGEKDADILMEHGLLATTMAGGVGMGWLDEYSEQLHHPKPSMGREVVVIPDNDRPGVKHAHEIIGSLLDVGLQRVGILRLPVCVKDVADYFAAGYTLDQFNELKRWIRWWGWLG